MVKNLPASAGAAGDVGLTPGLGRSPGEGHGNPLQYPFLGNSMNRGAWWVAESDMTEHACTHMHACPRMHIHRKFAYLMVKGKTKFSS